MMEKIINKIALYMLFASYVADLNLLYHISWSIYLYRLL